MPAIGVITFELRLDDAHSLKDKRHYLKSLKDRLRANDKTAQAVALFCLDNLLRLLHPFMPFLTEELWSRLPGERDYLMRASWPDDLHRYVDGQAEVEFERVSFAYAGSAGVMAEPPPQGVRRAVALSDISVKVAAGESLAIVGRSGSGKSTLVNLLPRFYDVKMGAVRIDGHDVRDFNLHNLREQIAVSG